MIYCQVTFGLLCAIILDLYSVSTATQPQNTYWKLDTESNFQKICFQLVSLAECLQEKILLKKNLICYLSKTEGRRKLKLGKVIVVFGSVNFFTKNGGKKFNSNAFLSQNVYVLVVAIYPYNISLGIQHSVVSWYLNGTLLLR